MGCPYYRQEGRICTVKAVKVDLVEWSRKGDLCEGIRHEACPLYFSGLFLEPETASARGAAGT